MAKEAVGGRRKPTTDRRLAKWQAPWDISQRYVRLSIESWLTARGRLGWGAGEAPFPRGADGSDPITIRIYERDEGKPANVGDSVKERSADDLIATFTGTFERHPTKKEAAIFIPSKAVDPENREITPGKPPKGSPRENLQDYVWINFEGGKPTDAYKVAVPTPAGEDEGLFFEIGFAIEHPPMDKRTVYVQQAVAIRPRHNVVLLAVEPLGQGDWGSLDQRTPLPIHKEIRENFDPGGKTLNRCWGDMVYKWRGGAEFGRMAAAGCSITSFTMALRYLRAPWARICKHSDDSGCTSACFQSVFENKIGEKVTGQPGGIVLLKEHRPFEFVEHKKVFRAKEYVPAHWWPVRLVWYARQLAGYVEELEGKGHRKLTVKKTGEVGKYMKAQGYIPGEGQPDLLKALGESPEKPLEASKSFYPPAGAWQQEIKASLDDGRPVIGCVSGPNNGGLGGHYMVMVGYIQERKPGKTKDKITFIWNDPGTRSLRLPALNNEDVTAGGEWSAMAKAFRDLESKRAELEAQHIKSETEVKRLEGEVKSAAKKAKMAPKDKAAKETLRALVKSLNKERSALKTAREKLQFLYYFPKWETFFKKAACADVPCEGRWKGDTKKPWTLKPPRRLGRFYLLKPPGWKRGKHAIFAYAQVRPGSGAPPT